MVYYVTPLVLLRMLCRCRRWIDSNGAGKTCYVTKGNKIKVFVIYKERNMGIRETAINYHEFYRKENFSPHCTWIFSRFFPLTSRHCYWCFSASDGCVPTNLRGNEFISVNLYDNGFAKGSAALSIKWRCNQTKCSDVSNKKNKHINHIRFLDYFSS